LVLIVILVSSSSLVRKGAFIPKFASLRGIEISASYSVRIRKHSSGSAYPLCESK
jgi:hypothetical protein